jgi:hypothetical protein
MQVGKEGERRQAENGKAGTPAWQGRAGRSREAVQGRARQWKACRARQ